MMTNAVANAIAATASITRIPPAPPASHTMIPIGIATSRTSPITTLIPIAELIARNLIGHDIDASSSIGNVRTERKDRLDFDRPLDTRLTRKPCVRAERQVVAQ